MARSPFIAPASAVARKTPDTLTPFEERFVLEYLIDLNGAAAYVRSGGNPVGAASLAARLMRRGSPVYIAVERAKAERAARTQITADNVLRELSRIVLGDPRSLFNEDGSLKKPHEYTRDDAAMLDGVKTRRIVEADENGNLRPVEVQEVKLTPKLPSVVTAMKHLGLLNEKVDLTVTAVGQRLEEAFRRTGRLVPGGADDPTIIDVYPDETTDDGGGHEVAQLDREHTNAGHGDDDTLDVEAMLR